MAYERYDADGDVSRYLRSPGLESHLLDVPAPEANNPGAGSGGQIQNAPAVDAHPAVVQIQNQAPEAMLGFQGPGVDAEQHQAPVILGFDGATIDVSSHGQHQTPEMIGFPQPTIDVGQHRAAIINARQHQATAAGVEHHLSPAFGFAAPTAADIEHHLPAPAFGFYPLTVNVGGHPVPIFGFQSLLLGVDLAVEHHEAQLLGFPGPNVDVGHHHLVPPFGFPQAAAMEVGRHQAVPMFGFQHQPAMDVVHHQASPLFGHQVRTNDIEPQQASPFVSQAPSIGAAPHNQGPAMDNVEDHLVPVMDDVEHHQALPDTEDIEHHESSDMEVVEDLEEPETDDVERYEEAPDIDDVDQNQAPALDGSEHHQAPATDVQPTEMPAPEEANDGVPEPTLEEQEAGTDKYDWVGEMLAEPPRFILSSPPRPSRAEETPVEDGPAYVPFVQDQMDCTRCCKTHELLHESGGHKLRFVVHVGDQGVFQHAILYRKSADADGKSQTLYADLRNRSHRSVKEFINSSVEILRKLGNCGKLQNKFSYIGTAPPNNNNLDAELEASMLGNIFTAVNVVGAAPGSSSQPVVQDEQNNNAPEAPSHDSSPPITQPEENNNAGRRLKPVKNLGFTPDILESSQVEPYDPKSSTGVLLYPSMLEKIHGRQQARESNLTFGDVSNMLQQMVDETATEPDFSSMMIFKQLCRKDKTYRNHTRRIKDLNRKIIDLKTSLNQSASAHELFSIKQKALMHKQEKEDIFTMIDMGLQECDEEDYGDAAGPSSS